MPPSRDSKPPPHVVSRVADINEADIFTALATVEIKKASTNLCLRTDLET